MQRRTAFVTGASRGIGKAIACALATAGFDVAITARTLASGDRSTVLPGTDRVLPGSLEETSEAVRNQGVRAVPIYLDLLDSRSIDAAVTRAIDELGHVDVLVNNAVYVGDGTDSLFIDTPLDALERRITANVTAQLRVTQPLLRQMLERGGGTIVNISSDAGQRTPRWPVGEGGWALGYAVSKAGFHRMADMIALEAGPAGIVAFNVNPGFVATERVIAAGPALDFVARRGLAPSVVGDVVAWLVTDGASTVVNGSYVHVVSVARELGLID